MDSNGFRKKQIRMKQKDARPYLEAALSISKLLKLYSVYADRHGFDSIILMNGIHALKCEIIAALELIEEEFRAKSKAKVKSKKNKGKIKK